MHNHPQRDEPPFWPTAVVAIVTIITITAVILGWDGIALIWEMISPF